MWTTQNKYKSESCKSVTILTYRVEYFFWWISSSVFETLWIFIILNIFRTVISRIKIFVGNILLKLLMFTNIFFLRRDSWICIRKFETLFTIASGSIFGINKQFWSKYLPSKLKPFLVFDKHCEDLSFF